MVVRVSRPVRAGGGARAGRDTAAPVAGCSPPTGLAPCSRCARAAVAAAAPPRRRPPPQPQLTWVNASWVVNTEALDYATTPPRKALSRALQVLPGQSVHSSIQRLPSGAYSLSIEVDGGAASGQTSAPSLPELRAYAVMEHQPRRCAALPPEKTLAMRLDAAPLRGGWTAHSFRPACSASCRLDPGDGVTFSWR